MLLKYYAWKKNRNFRKIYTTHKREPFYDVIEKFLPDNPKAVLLDIGAGNGSFPDYTNLGNRYSNLYLLDSNKETVLQLNKRYKNVIEIKIPEEIPFENESVDFIHCSHVIEHLYFEDVYRLLNEIDRILKRKGIVAISCPLLFEGFYSEMTHVKPYNQAVFLNYFISNMENQTLPVISQNYKVVELIYRYGNIKPSTNLGWSSDLLIIDLFLSIFSKLCLFRKFTL